MTVLETKLNKASVEEIMRRKFGDWHFTHNFASHNAGRILILWKQDKIHLSDLESNAQLIHCVIDCKTTTKRFHVSFIYGLHSIMARRSLWINLNSINANMNCPWLLISDFNSIMSPTDRFNGAELNAYELQDFVDCYSDLGLGSINTHGPLYTWTNGRVWSKLDRALCNQAWFNSFENSACEVMEFISISDHTPLVVTTELVVPRGNSPFKFNNDIVDHPNFLRIVADGWKQNIHGCSMFKVCKKLKALKAPLKNLFKQEFSNISNRVEVAKAEYNSVLNSLKQNPQDPSLLALANRTRGQTIMLRKMESMKFAQLIKNKYLLQADKCSKFFHALIKRNRHSRFIAAIRLEDGHNTSSQDEIALAFVNHFRNLFSAHELTQIPSISICNKGPKVSINCFAILLCPTFKQEVWNVISVMDNNKAPGPDGFNVLFFKKTWNIIGDDIFAAVNEFFTTGNIMKILLLGNIMKREE
ncbi:Transposon TX1 149 kDa protein [Glycine soja]|uniref:Transposon TX1 149 kDa protein n=2 Tax=Glycine soja TaxID=3848 RepID=A0A445GJL0_GLYSO|nr:Transposon TX1 149 kDa protein [Glycine soja]